MPPPKRHRGILTASPYWQNPFLGLIFIAFALLVLPSRNDPQALRPLSWSLFVTGVLILLMSLAHAVAVFVGKR
jgi:hypothetical protein